MKLTYKYRIYPNKEQEQTLSCWLNTCRILYNNSLQKRTKLWEKEKKSISCYAQINQLVKDKKSNLYLQEVHSQVLQHSLIRLDKAFQNFFRRVKNEENPGYPRFQGKDRFDSFTYPQFTFQLKDNKIKLPKIGYVKIKLHRLLKGKVKTCTVKRYVDQWYCMIVVEIESKEKIKSIKSMIGIDLGLEKFATLSNGNIIKNPRYLKKSEKKLQREQKKLSKKKKKSKNRLKQKLILGKSHRNIKNQRIDFCHKLSRKLVDTFDLLVFENLNIKSMLENKRKVFGKKLSKSISDASWNLLTHFCSYKVEYTGKYIEFVEPRNTSKTCCICGYINNNLQLEDRIFKCPSCKSELDRDWNASLNIRDKSKIGQDLPKLTPVKIFNRESIKQEAYNI